MSRRKLGEKGFTLIEVIVCLVLLGILCAVAGMGMAQIADGYVFARQNAETSQKAQVAIAKIVKELGAAYAVSALPAPTTNSVTYTRLPGPVTNRISFSATEGVVAINDVKIMNNVKGFTLAYVDAANNTTTVTENIRLIDITLTVNGANTTTIPYDKISVYLQEAP